MLLLNHDKRYSEDNFTSSLVEFLPTEHTYDFVHLYNDSVNKELVSIGISVHSPYSRLCQMIEYLNVAKDYDYYIITRPCMKLKSKFDLDAYTGFDGIQSRVREYWGPESIKNGASLGGDLRNSIKFKTFKRKKTREWFIMDDQFFIFPHSVRKQLKYEDWKHVSSDQYCNEWKLTEYIQRYNINFKILSIDIDFIRGKKIGKSSNVEPINVFLYIFVIILCIFVFIYFYQKLKHILLNSSSFL